MNEDIFILQSLRKCLKEYVMIWEMLTLNSGNQTQETKLYIPHDYSTSMAIININVLPWVYPGW